MKVAIVGGSNSKTLTYNVVEGLINSKHDIVLVVLRKFNEDSMKVNIFIRIIKYIQENGFPALFYRVFKKATNSTLNIKKICLQYNIKCVEEYDVNSMIVANLLSEAKPDVTVLAGSQLVKEHIINKAKLYTINIHRSLLPKYAGLDAIFWALYHDEKEIGATVHTVNTGIDTGDIIVQRIKKVENVDTLESLTDWYYKIAPDLIKDALFKISAPNHKFVKQQTELRSYFSRPSSEQKRELLKRMNNN